MFSLFFIIIKIKPFENQKDHFNESKKLPSLWWIKTSGTSFRDNLEEANLLLRDSEDQIKKDIILK